MPTNEGVRSSNLDDEEEEEEEEGVHCDRPAMDAIEDEESKSCKVVGNKRAEETLTFFLLYGSQ